MGFEVTFNGGRKRGEDWKRVRDGKWEELKKKEIRDRQGWLKKER